MTSHSFKQTFLYGLISVALAASAAAHAQDPTPQAKPAPREAAEQAREAQRTAREAAAEARTSALDEERVELEQLRTQMRELSRKMADLSVKVGDVGPREYAWRYIGDPERGMVGVVLDSNDQGLRVSAVTPGGAADKAGVRNDDIIIAVNGKPIDKKDRSPRATSLGDLKVGESITLTVQRDGKPHDYTMKAERRDPYNMAYAFGDDGNPQFFKQGTLPPDFAKRINEQTERAMAKAYASAGTNLKSLGNLRVFAPWWGLNLTGLNPDLGSYFGSDKGALVLSAEDDEFKQLKSGDVLKQVAGKQVERPEDAFRLLREQPAGSEVKVDVLRQHKPLTLTLRAPESSSVFVIPPPPPAAPAPPAPPAAPAAPAAPAPPAPPAPPAHLSSTLSAMPVVALSIDDDDSAADSDDNADEDDGG